MDGQKFDMDYQKKVLLYLEKNSDELLRFTRELIAAPSPNPPGEEVAVADLVVQRMKDLGLANPAIEARAQHRPNVIWRLAGQADGPSLVLSGHLDTKPVGDRSRWDCDPYRGKVEDGRLYGLGSGDMKAAVAAMIYAAAALKSAGVSLNGDLWLAFTADEEAGSEFGMDYLVERGLLKADAALLGEPAGISREWERLCLLSRGNCCFKIKVSGSQMHSSISDIQPSVNASVKMAGVMTRMARELLPRIRHKAHKLCPQGPTLNVGVIVKGGVYYGVYPGSAEFSCDLRTLPGMTRQGVEKDINGWLETLHREDPELEAQLEFEKAPLDWIEPSEIDAGHPVVEAMQQAAESVLGQPIPLGCMPGTTDAPKLQIGLGIPTIPAFGPGLLPLAHAPNEYISIKSPLQAAKIYALGVLAYLSDTDSNQGEVP